MFSLSFVFFLSLLSSSMAPERKVFYFRYHPLLAFILCIHPRVNIRCIPLCLSLSVLPSNLLLPFRYIDIYVCTLPPISIFVLLFLFNRLASHSRTGIRLRVTSHQILLAARQDVLHLLCGCLPLPEQRVPSPGSSLPFRSSIGQSWYILAHPISS
jgi:hypothetical protein